MLERERNRRSSDVEVLLDVREKLAQARERGR